MSTTMIQSALVPHLLQLHRGLTDEEVVGRVRSGEGALFELLLRRHNQRMFRVARAIVRSDDEAEDVVQQAWLLAYTRLAQFAGTARFTTWLTRVVINEALGRRRSEKRRREVDLVFDGEDEGEAAIEEIADEEERTVSPEEQAARRELTRIVEREVDALPEIYRVVFMLREVEDLSTAETAECLAISEEAVKVRLHRAKGQLRARLTARADDVAKETFAFLGARCDRIAARVLAQLALDGKPPA